MPWEHVPTLPPLLPATLGKVKAMFHLFTPTVMSPNLSQALPQCSAQVHDPSQVDAYVQLADHQCKKEETPASKSEQELYDVKEEPESSQFRRRRDSSIKSSFAVVIGAVRRPSQCRTLTIRILVRAQANLHGSMS